MLKSKIIYSGWHTHGNNADPETELQSYEETSSGKYKK